MFFSVALRKPLLSPHQVKKPVRLVKTLLSWSKRSYLGKNYVTWMKTMLIKTHYLGEKPCYLGKKKNPVSLVKETHPKTQELLPW